MPARPLKKNDTIEVRVADSVKTAFIDRCRRDGMSASEAIRGFIDNRLGTRTCAKRRPGQSWRIVAAGIGGAALGLGFATPLAARSAPETRAAFERLDRNHDHVLTYREFQRQ